MKEKDFELLLLLIPRVPVAIENRGHFADQTFKEEQIIIQNDGGIEHCIIWSGFISQNLNYDAGTYYAPSSIEADDPDINITSCLLYDESDEEVDLSAKQIVMLMQEIENSLEVSINPY